ncbi:MAG: hypothetical protein JO270_06285 [Acidobacteriaceae bacterium]|nr:hypothetical protein [Acidobacteriaceae bacterium]MBV8572864.1 hypothetical protein [Acidobacteriaceae bacterium]
MNKPFHLMTPEERTALRIAQNRVIAEKVAQAQKSTANPKKAPSAGPGGEGIRMTPEERAKIGGVIRKVQK